MRFFETPLKGAYIVETEIVKDDRGFFARAWCKNEFEQNGLNANLVQCNMSFNEKIGTLRGMHYQEEPYGEIKLVRCIKGAIYDVIIDIRKDSSTYKQWFSVELNYDNRKMLYVPEGFAHGFQTLEDNTEVFYQMSEFYYQDLAKGYRWDDKAFNINWPIEKKIISDKDKNYGDFHI